jgi:hypothetical protein
VGDLKECFLADWKTAREQKKPQWAQVLRTVLQTAKEDLTRADLKMGQRLEEQTTQQEQEQMQRKERLQDSEK